MSLRAIQSCILAGAESRDIRRVPRLERRDQLGQELAGTNDGIVDLALLDPGLLGIGITLLLEELIHLRRQGGGAPHDQFFIARRVGPAHQPPGRRRRQGSSRPGLAQDVASCQHRLCTSLSFHPAQRQPLHHASAGG